MANRICTYGGCKALATNNSRCDKHQRALKPQKQYEHQSHGRLNNIYKSQRWQKLREKKIQLNSICELCWSVGEIVPAQEVDHQLEIIDFKEFIWSIENLISLCSRCHRQKTALYRNLRKSNPKKLLWQLDQIRPLSEKQKQAFKEQFKL